MNTPVTRRSVLPCTAMKGLAINAQILFLLTFLYHYSKKCRQSYEALAFIEQHKHLVARETFERNTELKRLVDDFKEKKAEEWIGEIKVPGRAIAPAIMLLNQHALNITLNWLCNVAGFNGVHDRLIIFAFDNPTVASLRKNWPRLHVLDWPIEPLQNRFSTGDGAYQIFQIFRANLAAFMAEKSLEFWMIQSDTYWRANLFDRADPDLHMNYTDELLFDREGSSGLLADMIAGGNFFVKGTQKTAAFFERVSETLLWLYSTDNNLMGVIAQTAYSYFPISITCSTLSNWRWHYGDKKQLPSLLQFDGGTGSEGKLEKIRSLGAAFVTFEEGGRARCDKRKSAEPAAAVDRERLNGQGNDSNMIQMSLSFFHNACELLYTTIPAVGVFIRGTLFPFYAYFIMF